MNDLFGPVPTKPRRVMMHAVDVGLAGFLKAGWKSDLGGEFVCKRCSHNDGWSFNFANISEVRKGLPCPICNSPDKAKQREVG